MRVCRCLHHGFNTTSASRCAFPQSRSWRARARPGGRGGWAGSASRTDAGAAADRGLCRNRGDWRMDGGVAGTPVRRRPHGHRRRRAGAGALRQRDRTTPAVTARVIRLWPRGSACRIRQRDRDARRRGGHRHRGRAPAARSDAGPRRAGARHRAAGFGDQHRLRVASVARVGVAQRARRDDPRAGRLAGFARRDHRRRRHRRDRLDADRSDPVARRLAADPALDIAAVEAVRRAC